MKGYTYWKNIHTNIHYQLYVPYIMNLCTINAFVKHWMIVKQYALCGTKVQTRNQNDQISCTRVQCATLIDRSNETAILFFRSAEKHQLGIGCWDLASCQVSLNSVQWLQRRSRKCQSQSEARAAILIFLIGPKNTNLVEDIEILLPVKFR